MKRLLCKKCNKKWYRYFDKIISTKDVPLYCPHCEEDKLKKIPPVGLKISILGKSPKRISSMKQRTTFSGTKLSCRKYPPRHTLWFTKQFFTSLTFNFVRTVKNLPFMNSIMSTKRSKFKVSYSIIRSITVYMMNKFRSFKFPIKMSLHNTTVFVNGFFNIIIPNHFVSVIKESFTYHKYDCIVNHLRSQYA